MRGMSLFQRRSRSGERQELENRICQLELEKQEAQEAVTELKRQCELKSAYLSQISHEIRTQIDAINGLTKITAEAAIDHPVVADNMQKISYACQAVQNVIRDVLDMTTVEVNQIKIRTEEFDLYELVVSIGEMYTQLCAQKQIRFVLSVDERIKKPVIGDPLRVSQILNNLLSNALKYTSENGTIELSAMPGKIKERNIYVRFFIRDTGCGIKKEQLEQIFTPHIQRSGKSESPMPGAGIGLPVTSRLVHLMKGAVEVESVYGEGSTFTVSLPFQRVETLHETESSGEEKETAQTVDFHGHRIMLVDDTVFNRDIVEELLRQTGLAVVCARDGRQAVELFTESEPGTYDLILMDIQMPVMNGYDALRAIRRSDHPQAKQIPVLAMTANAFAEDISESFAVGMTDHLTKPVHAEELYQILVKYMNEK